jgi:hypothetical protein
MLRFDAHALSQEIENLALLELWLEPTGEKFPEQFAEAAQNFDAMAAQCRTIQLMDAATRAGRAAKFTRQHGLKNPGGVTALASDLVDDVTAALKTRIFLFVRPEHTPDVDSPALFGAQVGEDFPLRFDLQEAGNCLAAECHGCGLSPDASGRARFIPNVRSSAVAGFFQNCASVIAVHPATS